MKRNTLIAFTTASLALAGVATGKALRHITTEAETGLARSEMRFKEHRPSSQLTHRVRSQSRTDQIAESEAMIQNEVQQAPPVRTKRIDRSELVARLMHHPFAQLRADE